MVFMVSDKVSYVGTRFKLAGKLGTIEARVQNQDDTYVVDFGGEAYVMSGSLLTRPTYSQAKEKPAQDHKPKKNDNEPMIKEEKPKEARTIFISEEDQSYAD